MYLERFYFSIQDAKQLPTKTFQEKTAETSNQLRLQFPVSSGQHHRRSGKDVFKI